MSAFTRRSLIRRGQLSKRLSGRNSERPGPHGEQGLLMLSVTIVLMIVLSVLTFTIMTAANGELKLSGTATSRNGALEGALAGVQAVIANIRAASVTSGTKSYVVLDDLPCSNFSGVTNTSASSSFVASVEYQEETPLGSYQTVTCTQGQGPALPNSGDFLARAVITSCSPTTACPVSPTSAPTGNEPWRRVVSTYDFNYSYENIPGGLIYSYDGKECFVATYNDGTDTNDGVTLEVTTSCSASNNLELFQYTSTWNLAIELGGALWCVQNPEDESSPSTSPIPITQTSCTAPSAAVAQWGVNDVGGIEGVKTTGSPAGQPDGYCLDNPDPTDQTPETEDATVGTTNCDSGYGNAQTWQMSSRVGAGASQPGSGQYFGVTDQLVNFEEFGYCLDVTNQDVTSTFLIDYMCKQFPDTTDYPVWNQRWCFNQLSTNSSGIPVGVLYTPEGQTSCSSPSSPYCLTSPLEPASQDSSAYVTVTTCNPESSSQPNDFLWTEWGNNVMPTHEYTWTDNDGYCLEANTSNKQQPSGNGDYFSPIQVDTCNGSFEQKWNAPAILGESQITNTHEGTGTGAYSGS